VKVAELSAYSVALG